MTVPENLGSLSQRMTAAMIDSAVLIAPLFLLMAILMPQITDQVARAYILEPEEVTLPALTLPPLAIALLSITAMLFVIQGYFLSRDGQTIGKKATGIRIVRLRDGRNGGFWINVVVRTLVNGVLGFIPFYALIDIVFILRDNRRCLHDELAGTIVVKTALVASQDAR